MGTNTYYNHQLITYLGNKRKLLQKIEDVVLDIKNTHLAHKKREEISMTDLFSGSGVISRLLKSHCGKLYVNDFEEYSKTINECYLTNKDKFSDDLYNKYLNMILNYPRVTNGIIRTNYSPVDDKNITQDDRCFYTNENAILLDTYRIAIEKLVPKNYQKFYIAPLMHQASVHVNTGGMFKGFYKDTQTGIGRFGGTNQDSLKRILGTITIEKPILSDYDSEVKIYCEDSNKLVKILPKTDLTYIDSPYNQHPYGSNYFMLNIINKYEMPQDISKVSGIPRYWKKSLYYKRLEAYNAMDELISNLKTDWIVLSYSSNGIINYEEMNNLLSKYSDGSLRVEEIDYQVLKSSRNRKENKKKVVEYLFIFKKR